VTALPPAGALHAAAAATWPPLRTWRCGAVTLRESPGAGSRVNAATVGEGWQEADIAAAAAAMERAGRPALFMLCEGEERLDQVLAARGFIPVDPTLAYVGRTAVMAALPPVARATFAVWPPLAVQAEIWAEGGIGAARRAVMERAPDPKVSILGRVEDRPAGAVFAACQAGFGIVHALAVRPALRRRGAGMQMMRAAALWARGQGADWLGLVVTEANAGARALYEDMGMEVAGRYHYRVGPG
jgi:GNAT superfamily N-acetyltransferase